MDDLYPASKNSMDIFQSKECGNPASTNLCVQLDGTLVQGNLVLECFLRLIKSNPLYLFRCLVWALCGPHILRYEVTSRAPLSPALLPYNTRLLGWLREQRETGRHIWLCSNASDTLANRVATQFNIFSGVFASTRQLSFVGETRVLHLRELFGDSGFEYYGPPGIPLVVSSNTSSPRRFPIRAAVRAFRPHQWTKNALVFMPLLASHELLNVSHNLNALLAFCAFCLCASSVYITNDLLDLDADRAHARKRSRPFASGELPLLAGLALAPTILLLTVIISLSLPRQFILALGAYYVLTLLYSFYVKRVALLDVLALAALYTLRIVAGAAAINGTISLWMLLFAVFIFLSLALVKRFTEIDGVRRKTLLQASGRGYTEDDVHALRAMGHSSGYLSVLVIALYINSSEVSVLYRHPTVLWFLCLLVLYWISRVWIIAERGAMNDDPIVFALKDPPSLVVALLCIITVFAAI